jgi:hypothetical protein
MQKLAGPVKASILALLLAVAAFPDALEEECLRQLLTIRRVYVDKLAGGDTAVYMRDMIIGSLQNARLFLITEKEERADVILRGSAEDLVYTETYQFSDGVSARASLGSIRTGRSLPSASVSDHESERSSERKHEAVATVRLVNKEGDVIWSTTQESMGGKFRGSSSDVADKITRQLTEDYGKARKLASAPAR